MAAGRGPGLYESEVTTALHRYLPRSEEPDAGRRQQEVEKVNSDLLRKLKELDADLSFSTGVSTRSPQGVLKEF